MRYRNDTGRALYLSGIGRIDPGGEVVFEKAINSPFLTCVADEAKEKAKTPEKPKDETEETKAEETKPKQTK
ncbi:MAG: hypothetical protein M0R06_23305 [Sphaerochaeta sp.]|jgi:hypothetical protein|nr:hypothetical protein [Sphaerochaeta sp.]